MKEEKSFVAFESTPLRGERLLVLAPHPDDEVFGCGGLIAQHRRAKRDVHVVVVTDGAEADATVQDREAYRARREAESRAGLDELGGGTIEFLRVPDRGLAGVRDLPQTLATILSPWVRFWRCPVRHSRSRRRPNR